MGRTKNTVREKLKHAVLLKIFENKEVIFGKFSSTVTNEKKAEKWREVLVFGQEINLFDSTDGINKVKQFWTQERASFLVSITSLALKCFVSFV